MKNIVYILFLGLLLGSCAKERFAGDAEGGQSVEMKLSISTKANAVDDEISNVRIIVVNNHGDVKSNVSAPVVEGSDEYFATSRVGTNDFYVICNETAEMTSALNAITKSSDIEAIKIMYNSEISSSPLVMFGQMEGVEVKSTGDEDPAAYTVTYTDSEGVVHTGTKLPIAVKRLAVKVSLSFIKNTPDFTVSDISVKVVKMPKYSYLTENRAYDGDMGTLTIIKNSQGELLENNSVVFDSQTKTFKYDNDNVVTIDDIYIPEYFIAAAHKGDVDYQTAIIVSGKCTITGGPTIIGNWRIGLMDATNELPRNSWYKIAATITGMGAIGLYAEIEEVTQHNISVNWKPQDGLVIVSDLEADYGKNINVWNSINVYFGVLKTYNATTLTYTDVLFKYGSVVATRGSEPVVAGVTYTPVFDAGQDIMWQPKDLSISSWAGIPYLNSGGDVPSNIGNVTNGLGDPCKLVTLSAEQIKRGVVDNEQWHMATVEEYETLIKANDKKTGDIRGFNTFHLLLIPNSRVRDANGVLSNNADGKGAYWSSKGGKAFEFTSDANTATIVPYANTELEKGHTVRCVRNNIPESDIKLSGTTIPYSGGKGTISVNSGLPYWEATLITKDNVEQGETASDDNEIEFLSPLTGSYYGPISVKLGLTKVSRRYFIRVTGVGLDGKEHKGMIEVKQNAGSIDFVASFDPLLPKNFPSGGYETTVIYDFIPNDPDNVSIPTENPYYIWVEVYKNSIYEQPIFNSKPATEGGLGMLVVPGTYQYKIKIQIPANDNIDPRSIYIRVKSNKYRSFNYGPIIQESI